MAMKFSRAEKADHPNLLNAVAQQDQANQQAYTLQQQRQQALLKAGLAVAGMAIAGPAGATASALAPEVQGVDVDWDMLNSINNSANDTGLADRYMDDYQLV